MSASVIGGNMKVLVIGGAGYIGSHVVKELMANGHKVTVLTILAPVFVRIFLRKTDLFMVIY